MNNQNTPIIQLCHVHGCTKEATHYDEELGADLCDEHEGGTGNPTGYCSNSCQLGYGCDDSC